MPNNDEPLPAPRELIRAASVARDRRDPVFVARIPLAGYIMRPPGCDREASRLINAVVGIGWLMKACAPFGEHAQQLVVVFVRDPDLDDDEGEEE